MFRAGIRYGGIADRPRIGIEDLRRFKSAFAHDISHCSDCPEHFLASILCKLFFCECQNACKINLPESGGDAVFRENRRLLPDVCLCAVHEIPAEIPCFFRGRFFLKKYPVPAISVVQPYGTCPETSE